MLGPAAVDELAAVLAELAALSSSRTCPAVLGCLVLVVLDGVAAVDEVAAVLGPAAVDELARGRRAGRAERHQGRPAVLGCPVLVVLVELAAVDELAAVFEVAALRGSRAARPCSALPRPPSSRWPPSSARRARPAMLGAPRRAQQREQRDVRPYPDADLDFQRRQR